DAVHVNTSVPWVHHMLLEEAARAGVPARISHGHAGMSWERFPRSLAHSRCAHTMGRLATHLLACSEPAGRYLYGEGLWARRGEVVRNGIDVGAFALSKDVRRSVRGDLGTSLVVGSVTRFTEEKNVPFLLEVFAAVRGLRPDARLWLVGDGPQRQEVERRAAELGIADAVTFWGRRDDVPALLQGMDVLVMPSLWEGLPLSRLEAQASGLPCVTSQGVSAEVDVPGCPIRHLSLDEPTDTWARAVDDYAGHRNPRGPELVRSAGFDARDCAREMARLYRGLDAVVRA
ncbi:MAG: glycosyltransferase, partial [Atopobiaceae bacterium]|nr:glycosyltransferase [Atopobiaceae bacterium]